EVDVSSFDYGAFGTLSATARLTSGREINAIVQGPRGGKKIRAFAWKRDHDTLDDDRSDNDNAPEGDGAKGDGFTLFEEYRGVMIDHHWTDLDPKKKDFF